MKRRHSFALAALVSLMGLMATNAQAADSAALAAAASAADGRLHYFSVEPQLSGSTAFNLGDRFVGPGVVTVGWLGSKKQIVLPAGEWVALAMVDHPSREGAAQMGTVAFGQFQGQRLATLLEVTFNRRATRVRSWPEMDACLGNSGSQWLHHWATSASAVTTECEAVSMAADAPGTSELAAVASERRESLERLGAAAPSGPASVARIFLTRDNVGYLGVTRIDWNTSEQEARERLVPWLERYRALVETGFRRGFDRSDLQPTTGDAPAAAASRFDLSTLDSMQPK
jgi:hypothetical protein